jgi:hypothetical protein
MNVTDSCDLKEEATKRKGGTATDVQIKQPGDKKWEGGLRSPVVMLWGREGVVMG